MGIRKKGFETGANEFAIAQVKYMVWVKHQVRYMYLTWNMILEVKARSGMSYGFNIIWLEILLRLCDNISEHVECEVTNGHVLGRPYKDEKWLKSGGSSERNMNRTRAVYYF